MERDKFDVWGGTYAYARDYHSGQWSTLYLLTCRMESRGYRPGLGVREGNLTEGEQAEYDRLAALNYGQ